MIKLCIFDLDGTVLNTLSQIEYYVNCAMRQSDLPQVPRDKIREFVGYGAKALLKKCLEYAGRNSDDEEFFGVFHKKYLENYNSDINYLAEVYSGIKDALRYIKSLGITLAILSNKPHSTLVPTVSHFFGDIFDIVIGGSEKYPLKPNPKAAAAICEKAFATPDETLIFGDGETDMECAENLGAQGVGVLWGFRDKQTLIKHGAKALLSEPSDIITFIKEKTE